MGKIIVLGGENTVFAREEFEKILASAPKEGLLVRYGDEVDVEDFFSDLRTGSLFSMERLIAVRNADACPAGFEKALLDYIKNPVESTVLMLWYAKIPAKIERAISDLGAKTGQVLNFKRAYAQDLRKYVVSGLEAAQTAYDPKVPEILVEISGQDVEELAGMLSKLLDYAGGKRISDEDVYFALERARNSSIFDLIDAVFARNTPAALEAFSDLIYAGESLVALNVMLLRAARIMWAAKTSQGSAVPQGLAVSAFEWKKYQTAARKVPLKFVSRMLECVACIEFETKTRPEIFGRLALEKFLLELDQL